MIENVTLAMNTIAHGLDLDADAEVLMTDREHSGSRSAWLVQEKRFRIKVTPVPLPDPCRDPEQIIDLFLKAITPRTRIIAISHMVTRTGSILPVKQICSEAQKRGIFTVFDGAQCVRRSTHIYNSPAEIDATLEVVTHMPPECKLPFPMRNPYRVVPDGTSPLFYFLHCSI